MKPANFEEFVPLLQRAGVAFIIVGGGAGMVHGLARATYDVDVVYSRSPDNLKRIVDILRELKPYPRGAPRGLPFLWDEDTLKAGLNFTLSTSLGYIDILGEITGGGTYEQLLPFTVETRAFGVPARIVTLEKLIQLKKAAGRPKDFEVLSELQALLDERNKSNQ